MSPSSESIAEKQTLLTELLQQIAESLKAAEQLEQQIAEEENALLPRQHGCTHQEPLLVELKNVDDIEQKVQEALRQLQIEREQLEKPLQAWKKLQHAAMTAVTTNCRSAVAAINTGFNSVQDRIVSISVLEKKILETTSYILEQKRRNAATAAQAQALAHQRYLYQMHAVPVQQAQMQEYYWNQQRQHFCAMGIPVITHEQLAMFETLRQQRNLAVPADILYYQSVAESLNMMMMKAAGNDPTSSVRK